MPCMVDVYKFLKPVTSGRCDKIYCGLVCKKNHNTMEKSNVIREIYLTAAAKTVLKERKPLTVSVVAGVVMGLVIALSSLIQQMQK